MFVVVVRQRHGVVSNFHIVGSYIKGAAPGPAAAAGSCVGAAPRPSEGATTDRCQISNPFEGAAPPKFDKKFQISMGAVQKKFDKINQIFK